jgi:hypothetical protein
MKHPLITSALLAAVVGGMTLQQARAEAPTPEPAQLDALRATAKSLAMQLGGRLKQEMEANGPEAAVSVCKQIAPQIAADLSRQTGWKVGRVGTRARNAASGTPDAWDERALAVFAARMKQGEKPDAMEFAEVLTAPSGERTLRYAKAIALQPMCVTCHGAPEGIAQGVRARLQADYPLDRATGYGVGDLRGAVVIARPL